MLSKLVTYINTQEPIPVELMLASLHEIEDTFFTQARRDAANAIMPQAGDYLTGTNYLTSFITAEITDQEAATLISARKTHVERARHILPTVLRLVSARDNRRLYTALRMVEDCCHDFPLVLRSQHENVQRKEIAARLHQIIDATLHLQSLLEDAWKHVEIEYDHHKAAIARTEGRDVRYLHDFNKLQADLDHLKFVAVLSVYKDAIGNDDAFYVGNNKAKTHIVECAYRLSVQGKQPKLVTTPGSDFSLLCSLIYEIASGDADVSLSGAINKFSRSELRKRIDCDEAETRWENSDEYAELVEQDNFSHTTEEVANLTGQHDFWRDMMSARTWDSATTTQIAMRATDAKEQISNALRRTGPFIVWASQYSEEDLKRSRQRMEEEEARLLNLQIELGERRRRARRN